MKKYFSLLVPVSVISIMLMFISGCSQSANIREYVYDSCDMQLVSSFDETCDGIVEDYEYLADANTPMGIGGPLFECSHHTFNLFHSYSMFWELAEDLVCVHDIVAWEAPLREIEAYTHECLVNYLTFIEYFGISREAFQERIDNNIWMYIRFGGETLDVLYSGNRTLIDQFFAQDGLAVQGASERERRYWTEKIIAAQEEVNENTAGMSLYFHDVWTYFHFSGNMSMNYHWMRALIDAGEYDRVNIVEFINHVRLYRESSLSPGMSIFEHWATHDNLNIFTHYNFEVLLSGDMARIRAYYAIENEAAHTAQVQARFQQYVATHGYTPDTSWMIDRNQQGVTPTPPPALITLNIFNNGPGGSPSGQNPNLQQAGTIRIWPQEENRNTSLPMSTTITAVDEDNNDAMDFVRINQMWGGTQGWLDTFNYIDVNKNAPWQTITLSITTSGQTIEAILVNSNHTPEETPYFHTRVYAEDWRPNIVIWFFHGGPRYTNQHRVAIDDIMLYVDGQQANIRDFATNIAPHQADIPTLQIPRALDWQEITITVTELGETITHTFTR